MKINCSNWKKFKFGNLIKTNDIYKAKAYYKEELNLYDINIKHTIPYVTRTEPNNSVEGFALISEEFEGIEKGNALTIGDTTSTISYQEDDFIAGDHIVVIHADWLNRNTGLFMVALLSRERFRYSYGRAFVKELICNTEIMLPVNEKNEPDFEWIEKFIDSLNNKVITTKNRNNKKMKLNISNWQEFKVGSLFEIENCKCSNASEMLEDGNDIEYKGAKKNDNGFMKKVKYNADLISKGNCMIFICDGQGSVGYVNYEKNDFIGSTTLSVGYNKKLNKYIGLFLVSVLDLERYRYSFGRKYKNNLENTIIRLPAIKDSSDEYSNFNGYAPNWRFMEEYIKSLSYGDRI